MNCGLTVRSIGEPTADHQAQSGSTRYIFTGQDWRPAVVSRFAHTLGVRHMPTIKAHCNECSGERNHEVLHTTKSSWSDDESGVSGGDKYEMIRCLGCEAVRLKHTNWFSEEDGVTVRYYPPAIFRRQPDWFGELWLELCSEDEFVEKLLKEIYVALQNNLPSLAAMGVRSLLEKVMVSKTGDNGSFTANKKAFERLGYGSRVQCERLEAILEVGHAAIHRVFTPNRTEVVTLVDIAEHIIETVYLHESKVKELRKRVPPRAGKKGRDDT